MTGSPRWVWRNERWAYSLLIINVGLFFAPIYWAYRNT